jgi:hypothetical protein
MPEDSISRVPPAPETLTNAQRIRREQEVLRGFASEDLLRDVLKSSSAKKAIAQETSSS